ncbi:MAG: DNA polymerase Y family protein [Candidatus Obscuribacterales bacterium]|nr:DNA polymerase Y family protein [Candidatus Obscuribacterales bacterium]
MLHRSRIACLRIPKFQIVAHQKDEPGLKGKPLVIVKGSASRSQVLICSKEASKQRVYPGMKLSEARAVCADLVWREYDELLYRALQKDLLHKLVAVSPKVSATEPGVFLLDASGMLHLGGEEKFCRRVQKLVSTVGFPDVHTGVADSAFAALVASKFKKQNHFIVPIGQGSQFLAGLSVSHLPREFTLTDTLLSLGIKTMGQLLNMPVNEVIDRFGDEGLRAYELAGGNDNRFPESVLPEQEFHSAIELGFPVESLQQTQFILKSMLTRLCEELKEHSFHCHSLSVSFYNDDEQFDDRTIKLIRPSNSPVFLLELIKLSLESRQLSREFTGVKIGVDRFSAEDWKQNKIGVKKSSAAISRDVAAAATQQRLSPAAERITAEATAAVAVEATVTQLRLSPVAERIAAESAVTQPRLFPAMEQIADGEAVTAPRLFSAAAADSTVTQSRVFSDERIEAESQSSDIDAHRNRETALVPHPIMTFNREAIYSDSLSLSKSTDSVPVHEAPAAESTSVLRSSEAPGARASSPLQEKAAIADAAITTDPAIPESGKAKKAPAKRKPSTKRASKKSASAAQLEITSVAIENGTSISTDFAAGSSNRPAGSLVHLSTYDRSVLDKTAARKRPSTVKSSVEDPAPPQIVVADDASDEHFVIDGDNMDQSEPLALLLQRFVSRLGPNSLVRSVPNDQHLPDSAGSWLPVGEDIPEGTVLPLDISCGEGTAPFACGLVLRKSPSPEPVLVEYKGHLPQAVTYRGRWYRIRELTEPEKLSGLWWENPVCKSYYVALIEAQDRPYSRRSSQHGGGGALLSAQECEGLLVLLVRDHSNKSWQIEGFFD